VALSPGTRLGRYQVAAEIGAGGMGEVYRATDPDLKRDVAIKVLPATLASDPERLTRFQREAEILASLNHPNIAIIYGLEKADSVRAIVMELVTGSDLAHRIALGPVPIDQALRIGKQIAEALEAAHQAGVIHRDLKPSNVKVRPDGTVKVLDFGLAKALEPEATNNDPASCDTCTSPANTIAGVILGTAAYMSPEQARGQAVDKRTDIWAFGCVLYEMLTARAPFARDTTSDSMAAILARDPDWSALPRDLPAVVGRLMRRCLAKDRQHRLRDIGDARLEIEEALASPTAAPHATVETRWRRRAPWAVAVVATTATVAVLGWDLWSRNRRAVGCRRAVSSAEHGHWFHAAVRRVASRNAGVPFGGTSAAAFAGLGGSNGPGAANRRIRRHLRATAPFARRPARGRGRERRRSRRCVVVRSCT